MRTSAGASGKTHEETFLVTANIIYIYLERMKRPSVASLFHVSLACANRSRYGAIENGFEEYRQLEDSRELSEEELRSQDPRFHCCFCRYYSPSYDTSHASL